MSPLRYQIGQQVWWASFESSEDHVVCPDCNGMKYIRVLLYDDTMLTIKCEGCSPGYEPATGYVRVYTRKPRAVLTTITRLEIQDGKVEWGIAGSYRVDDDELFDTEEDALAAATLKTERADREERERVNHKEKPTRSWSWHVHYYRREIRRAEADIVRYTAALNVARVKAREPEST